MRKCELCGGPMERDRRYTKRKIFVCRNHPKPVTVEDPGYEREDETRVRRTCALEGCDALLSPDSAHTWQRYHSPNHRLRAWRQRKRPAMGRNGGSEERPVIAAKL